MPALHSDLTTLLHVLGVAILPILAYNAEIWLHTVTTTTMNMMEKVYLIL